LEDACAKWDKCEFLSPELIVNIVINGEAVEKVDSFVFLGSTQS